LILSLKQHLVRSTNHEALHYAVFSSHLIQVSSSWSYSQSPSACLLLSVFDITIQHFICHAHNGLLSQHTSTAT
jgi:hypothetical protein